MPVLVPADTEYCIRLVRNNRIVFVPVVAGHLQAEHFIRSPTADRVPVRVNGQWEWVDECANMPRIWWRPATEEEEAEVGELPVAAFDEHRDMERTAQYTTILGRPPGDFTGTPTPGLNFYQQPYNWQLREETGELRGWAGVDFGRRPTFTPQDERRFLDIFTHLLDRDIIRFDPYYAGRTIGIRVYVEDRLVAERRVDQHEADTTQRYRRV